MTSPCRNCPKVAQVTCRRRCKKLEAFVKALSEEMDTFSFTAQYAELQTR